MDSDKSPGRYIREVRRPGATKTSQILNKFDTIAPRVIPFDSP
jgi:hypothetical protein